MTGGRRRPRRRRPGARRTAGPRAAAKDARSPVRRAGFSSSAHASLCWYEGRGAERRAASATVSAPGGGVEGGDDAVDDANRVAPVAVRALPAPGPACRSRLEMRPVLAACRARLPVPGADAAVPVLATALQGAQRLAAPRACRRRDPSRPRPGQRDQQVSQRPGRGRPAVGQDRGPPGQGQGQPALLGPTPGDGGHRRPDRVAVQARARRGRSA